MTESLHVIIDLDARARWHLEIGYPEPAAQQRLELTSEDDGYEGGPYTCWRCGGAGHEVICCDDLCRGAGYCMHGDGERTCRECRGEGVL